MSLRFFLVICLATLLHATAKSTPKDITPRECMVHCIELYNPVCAECDGKLVTFGNTCAMNIRNCLEDVCVLKHLGVCDTMGDEKEGDQIEDEDYDDTAEEE